MDFINKNMLIKMIIPILMAVLGIFLFTTVLPFILILIALIFGLNFLIKKFNKVKNNIKYKNNEIDIEEIKNEETVFDKEAEIIDVEYREV